jgi:5-methyltetrahydrofolate--homocysteine methyltransferase
MIRFGKVKQMETKVWSSTREVCIGNNRATVLIGERINPTGKKKLSQALMDRDFDLVRGEALAQVSAGADILDVNVGITGVDEVDLLRQVVQVVAETVDVPLCIDSNNIKAIDAALSTYQGKALINSVSGKERSLKEVLPVVKQHGAAVIALLMDERGIPNDPERRVEVASKILEEAERIGMSSQDVLVDCLSTAVGADSMAGVLTVQTIQKVKADLRVNTTMGASNISFGLPSRDLLGSTFLAIAIGAGLDCAIVNVVQGRPVALAADLVLGRDDYAMRYIRLYRETQGL